jgi:hypothetical protein
MIDLKKSLQYSYDMSVDKAYIITVKGNSESENMSKGCQLSCHSADMPYEVWDAFDGTDGINIKIPEHSKDSKWLTWLKQMDHHLSVTEIACFMSHVSLWAKCIEQDRPLVILEHDAVMLKSFPSHPLYNSICYLGCMEQKNSQLGISGITPPHGTLSNNYHFICRAHAYSIDPAIAKNMMAYVIGKGITESLDAILRADLFTICQIGMFAFDRFDGNTTIVDRKKNVRLREPNVGPER